MFVKGKIRGADKKYKSLELIWARISKKSERYYLELEKG